MRALRLLIVLLPTLALAGWRQLGTLGGTPRDVVVVDAGMVVATSSGAGGNAILWVANADGGVTTLASLPTGNYVGAGVVDGGCLVALDSAANLSFAAGCGTTVAGISSTGLRLRVFGNDQLVMTTTTGINDSLRIGPASGTTFPVVGSTMLGGTPKGLQTARIGGADFHVVNQISNYALSVDGGAWSSIAIGKTLRDLSPFERGGVPSLLAITTAGELVLVPDVRATPTVAPTFPSNIAAFVGMAPGASLVTTTTGEVWSPIPDPARYGELWRARTGVPALMTNRVHCLDARWCAAVDATGGVWLYEDAAAPVLDVPSLQVDAGATVRLTADAGDGDGDPLFLSWSGVSVTPVSADGYVVDAVIPAGAACGPLPFTVTARDGLHVVPVQSNLEVVGHGTLQTNAPVVAPETGGAPVTFSAFIDGGCDSASLSWSTSDGQSGTGAQLTWTPPKTVCATTTTTITATATWSRGLPSTTTAQEVVTLAPWGLAEDPVFPAPASQLGGTTVLWRPIGTDHACAMTTGFPGTELVWEPILPGAATVTPLDGGLLVTAAECVGGQLTATARRRVVGGQLLSDAGTIVIDLQANVAPLDATTPFTLTAAGDAGVVFGELSVLATCQAQRALEAQVSVFGAGMTLITDGTFDASGPWSLPVPNGCAGGNFEIVARLFEDGGDTGASDRQTVMLSGTPVAVGAQSVSQLLARCGEGVRSTVSLLPVAGTCAATETSWRQVSGPPLSATSGVGPSFELQTERTDVSMAGERLVIEWSVDGGGGLVATETRTLDVSVDPFVLVSVRSSPVLRREESAYELELTLKNTTACAADGLTLEVPFSGATPVLDSVLVDGVRTAARLQDGALVLDGVGLPADGAVVIRLAARARLLATPSVDPVVSLHGLVVSMTAPDGMPVPSGCGCTSGTDVAGAISLALLVLARRRRRAE